MPINMKKTAAAPKATVTKTMSEKGQVSAESQTEEAVAGAPVPGNKGPEVLAMVGFSASYTHNLGNFKSARCEVSLVLPSEIENINKVFDYAKEWVANRMDLCTEEMIGGTE